MAALEPVLATGTCLGNYRIVRLLGAGGMGQVFEAVHVKLGRRVALKLLTAHRDASLLTRLEREARAAAQMHHPNIVQVTELHLPEQPSAEDPAYLVMEFVDGYTLQQRIDAGGALDAASVRRIGVQIASALSYAHERGVIHRDVKPDNILLTEVPGVGLFAKLLDFGIARILEETVLTRAGTLVGTPSFMSPEQALGGQVGPASDVFGLGATLYLALFGRLPFPGKGLSELSMQLASPVPAKAPVDAVIGDRALVDAILRCLAKDADSRPASGAELKTVFQLEDLDTLPLPGSERAPALTVVRERPARARFAFVAGAAALVLLSALAVSRMQHTPTATHPPVSSAVPVAASGGADPALPPASATPVDLVLGDNRPCVLLSSGEVHCWSLEGLALWPGQVPGTGALHVDAIRFAEHRLLLRAGKEHSLFLGNAVTVDEPHHHVVFQHAPVPLGDDEPLAWTCPVGTRGCFVWSHAGMRWADEERGLATPIPRAPECQTTAVDAAYPAGEPWLWLLRCGTISYYLAHDQLRDRRPPDDLFLTRVVTGLPPKSQLLGAGDGTLKVRHADGKSYGYHPRLLPPSGDPSWKQSAAIDAGYRIPYGPTERSAPPDRGRPPCVLSGTSITCDAAIHPELEERARRLGTSFGASGARRVWSSRGGVICAYGDAAANGQPWVLRCIGNDLDLGAANPATETPRDVLF